MEPCSPKGEKDHKAPQDKTAHHKKNPNRKGIRIGAFFGILEVLALVLWVKSEDFGPDEARYARWAAICGFLAGGGFLAHKLTGGRFRVAIISGIWITLAIVCTLLFLTIPEVQKPDFVISLRFGESHESELLLTNDFLTEWKMIHRESLSNDVEVVQRAAPGCILIPVKKGETNKVFRFNVENVSSLIIGDLEIAAGFPLGWECRVDPAKLRTGNAFLLFGPRPGWPNGSKWIPTNMQYFLTQNPPELFPLDNVDVPAITNPCANESFQNGVKTGMMNLIVRCNGYNKVICANLFFAPEMSNFVKPLIICLDTNNDGSIRFLTNDEQFKQHHH
jgi:hypothetical protein